jgi:hypothetical protein
VIAIGGVTGMWVSTVETGSPADRAGDFITRIEHVDIEVEGTKRRYCEIGRSQGAGNEIAVELIRPTTGEVLAGTSTGPIRLRLRPTSGPGAD